MNAEPHVHANGWLDLYCTCTALTIHIQLPVLKSAMAAKLPRSRSIRRWVGIFLACSTRVPLRVDAVRYTLGKQEAELVLYSPELRCVWSSLLYIVYH